MYHTVKYILKRNITSAVGLFIDISNKFFTYNYFKVVKTLNEIMYKENHIREVLKHENKELVYINIKYPEFSPKTEFTYINNFYNLLAIKYYEHIKSKYFKDAIHRYETYDNPRKRFRYKADSICMNYKITLMNDRYLSLYLDNIVYVDNKPIKHKRYSQTWINNTLYTLNSLFCYDKRFKSYGESDFYISCDNLILYNHNIEEMSIPLNELKIKKYIK